MRLPGAPAESSGCWRRYVAALVCVDALAVLGAAVVGQAVRFGELWGSSGFGSGWLSYRVVVGAMVPLWLLVIVVRGGYDPSNLGSGSEEYRRVLDAAVRYLALVATAAFALRYEVARGFVVIAIPLATFTTLAGRYLARRWLHRQRARGRFQRRLLVVGTATPVAAIADRLARSPYTGMTVVAACLPDARRSRADGLTGVPVVGTPEEAVARAQELGVDGIVVADATAYANGSLRRLAWNLEGTGIGLLVAPDLADMAGPRITVRPAADIPLLHLAEPEFRGWRRLTKSAVDRAAASLALVVLAPVLLLVSLIILVADGRPVFFRQERVGLGGAPFRIWKFRTMSPGAEALVGGLLDLNESDGPLFKIRDDPRVTGVGRFLRRWSLDELPQLWNVVRGEMSLVGPRPPLPCEVEAYALDVHRRLLVKPGMTGLWQVSGRSGLTWEESVRLDLHYVENWSPSLDAMILARTMVAVARGRGAC